MPAMRSALRVPFLFVLGFAGLASLHAQRQWGLSDSTSYAVGGDTTLIASRHILYRALSGDTTVLWDFTDIQEPGHYIRDLDHWSSSEFHVLVGSRYIGGNTTLFHSTDAGATWQVDSSFYDAADEPPSLNQMSIVGDTAYLFNGYYISEVLRSFDRGATWQNWFGSLIAHYYGIIPCGEDAFIFGMVGDAFPPSMWQVPDTLWEQQGIQFWSGCHNGGQPQCHYSLNNQYAAVVSHFDSIATSLCALGLGFSEPDAMSGVRVVPNPTSEHIQLPSVAADAELWIVDALGRVQEAPYADRVFDVSGLCAGVYFVIIRSAKELTSLRFVKE